MAWTKAKIAVVVGAAIILVAGTTSIVITKTTKSGNSSSNQKPTDSVSRQDGDATADRTTPKRTMFIMANAMEAGDTKSYIDSFVFKTSDELKLKPTSEALIAAIARFNYAISNKFGADAAHAVFPNMPFVIPTNIIASLEEKIQGDSATVSLSAAGDNKGTRPVQFTKIDGEWKMAADGFVHLSPTVMNDIYARVIKALDQTTPEIPQGKFKTAMEAVDKMKERAR
ncbi:MAG: polymerase, sigma-24 subunit, subfamily [Verrucomicrobiales bacterium]|nr:polymerase, sigma-24 subunit, subfamily [Verrucomicrobiales bacterium]